MVLYVGQRIIREKQIEVNEAKLACFPPVSLRSAFQHFYFSGNAHLSSTVLIGVSGAEAAKSVGESIARKNTTVLVQIVNIKQMTATHSKQMTSWKKKKTMSNIESSEKKPTFEPS